MNKSVNNLKARNIFESVKKSSNEGSAPGLKVINIEVEEKATGEIFAGAGVGTSGGTIGGGVGEHMVGRCGIKDSEIRIVKIE